MEADISVQDHGSIVILEGVSDEGKAWLAQHLTDAMTWGRFGYVAEPRYVNDIVAGAMNDGLVVQA